MTYVMEALELEDTVKNYERGSSTGWFVLIMFPYSHFSIYFFECPKLDAPDLRCLYAIMLGNIFQASSLLALGSWVLPLIQWVIARYSNLFLSFEFQSITMRVLSWFVISLGFYISFIDGLAIKFLMRNP
jgi:hypothetical protein